MATKEERILPLILDEQRFTQDSPVYTEVWKEYDKNLTERLDLILTPYRGVPATLLLKNLKEKLVEYSKIKKNNPWELSTTGEYVVAKLTIQELISVALPLTRWFQKYLWVEKLKKESEEKETEWTKTVNYILLEKIIELINSKEENKKIDIDMKRRQFSPPSLWSISLNRKAFACLYESIPATKADAGRRVFDIDATGMTWAILDTGIDATHLGFRQIDPKTKQVFEKPMLDKNDENPNKTRIVETYDFTQFRNLISEIFNSKNEKMEDAVKIVNNLSGFTMNDKSSEKTDTEITDELKVLEGALKNGRMLDWSVIGPSLRIPHNSDEYGYEDKNKEKKRPTLHPHGTHVAGILGANDIDENTDKNRRLIGMCPNINLYDIRVLDKDGKGDEFNILAAIQFVRWLNSQSDSLVIQGINLSLSMIHDVDSFAAGRTPVCDACQRLVSEGTVVVAAAGNLGQSVFQNTNGNGSGDGYRTASITDPGNAECVITVGATHRSKPHTYGVSYFSSRGPTGDGRLKPDLVAPGEKIMSLIPDDDSARMDGSSMAAPHVSGAAALLLAKHKELIGNPQRVKEILCKTATDLGRERYFQGHGMIDVLRALQCV
jgi:serine protease AprX